MVTTRRRWWASRVRGETEAAVTATPEQHRADVVEAIRSAFADDASAPDGPMIRTTLEDPWYRTLEDPFRALAVEPTLGALEHRAIEACYLEPRAERWFWRTYLLAVLTEPPWAQPLDDGTWSVVSAVVRGLQPNPCAVRDGRTDYEDTRALRERLSSPQRVAISRFLGLPLQHTGPTRTLAYSASQAIAWCWTDHAPTREAARALRDEARSHQRPPAPDSTSEALARAVERVFADTPAPTGSWMAGTREEPSTYELELAGCRWQDLAPWFVDRHSTAFCFMTDEAFRYLLPAALRQALTGLCEVSLTFHLVDLMLDPSRDSRDRILAFSDPERTVVADVLDWLYCVGEDEPPEDVVRAIQDLWDPETGVQSGSSETR